MSTVDTERKVCPSPSFSEPTIILASGAEELLLLVVFIIFVNPKLLKSAWGDSQILSRFPTKPPGRVGFLGGRISHVGGKCGHPKWVLQPYQGIIGTPSEFTHMKPPSHRRPYPTFSSLAQRERCRQTSSPRSSLIKGTPYRTWVVISSQGTHKEIGDLSLLHRWYRFLALAFIKGLINSRCLRSMSTRTCLYVFTVVVSGDTPTVGIEAHKAPHIFGLYHNPHRIQPGEITGR